MKIQSKGRKSLFFVCSLFLAASSLLYACGAKQDQPEGGSAQEGAKEEYILYYKKNTLNQYSLAGKKGTEIAKGNYTNAMIADDVYHSAAYSEDGRYLYFIDYDKSADYTDYRAEGVLKVKDLQSPDEKPVKISAYVGEFQLLKSGKILYMKNSNQGLYLWDGEHSDKISGSVESYNLNEDETRLLFTVEGSMAMPEVYDAEYYALWDLYKADLEKEQPERERLARDITYYYGNTLDLNRAYFEILAEGGPQLYCLKDLEDLVKIEDAEISDVLINENTGNIYYQKKGTENDVYERLVEDDLLEADLKIEAPSITPEDKEKMAAEGRVMEGKGLREFALKTLHEELRENLKFMLESPMTLGGEYYYFDGEKSVKIHDMAQEIYMEGRPDFDIAFTKSLDENKIEKKKFSELFELYLKRLNSEVFGMLGEEEGEELDVDRLIYEYYKEAESPLGEYFSTGEEVSDDYGNDQWMQEEPMTEETLLYEEEYAREESYKEGMEENYGYEGGYEEPYDPYDEGDYEDVYDPTFGWDYEYLAGYSSYEAFDSIEKMLGEASDYYIVQGSESRAFPELEYISQITASEKEDVIYYTMLSEEDQKRTEKLEEEDLFNESSIYQYTLFGIEYKDGALGEPEKIDEDVQHIEEMHGGEIYYLKDMDGNYGIGTLYKSGKKLEDDVSDVYILEDQVFILSDPDAYDNFNLFLEKEGETVRIADEIHSFAIFEGGEIAYIGDYNHTTERGTLYLRDREGNTKEIDQEVRGIIDQFLYYGF